MDREAEKLRDERNIAMLPWTVLLCVGIYIEGKREVIGHFQIIHSSYRPPESPVGRQIIVIKLQLNFSEFISIRVVKFII